MPRGSDPVKVELWRERFARFKDSSMTAAEFSAAEGISKHCFYAWRRKLGLSTPRSKKSTRSKSFQQVVVTSAPAALTARLPGGIQIDVPGCSENALRAVVSELVCAGRHIERESAAC